MDNIAIRVENLGKEYRIGRVQNNSRYGYKTLREALTDAALKPVRSIQTMVRHNGHRKSIDTSIWALKGISLEIKSGEAVGIIGRNGAGKSTLLKILSRITEPTEGYAEIHGKVGSLLEVGTGFHPELTGRENIYLNGAILGMKKAEIDRRFDEIVAFAEVEKFIDTPVKHYSSGMYLRLAFAVAAHLEPEILIVDEVLAVGDAEFQKKCLGKMQDVSKGQGRTVLFVSHNMNAIQRLCNRCIMLEHGQMLAQGETLPVVTKYIASGSYAASPNKFIDLSNVTRTGTGEVRFVAAQYNSFNEAVALQPYSDGPLQFILTIVSDSTRAIDSLAVILYDQTGTKLINADTILLDQVITLTEGRNEVRLLIKSLYLKPGIYVVGLWLAQPPRHVFDYIEGAFEVEVLNFASSRVGVLSKGDGLVTCQFEFSKAS